MLVYSIFFVCVRYVRFMRKCGKTDQKIVCLINSLFLQWLRGQGK